MEEISVIEFKTSKKNTRWEDTPIEFALLTTAGAAQLIAKKLANKKQAVIRWNYKGSPQGHYIMPEII